MDPVEEKLASFYLGQEYDLSAGQALEKTVHYDARDLTTHGVILGMTGSGKTGLGVIVLEEAALDGVPSLVIDPKGDMTNLLLTFPELRPEDFLPWVNPDDARRKNMEMDAFAASTADSWRKGLAGTGQGPDRIRRLKEAADFAIYTPGSEAGQPLSILQTLNAPDLSWDTDSEAIRDRIESVASALLALVGVEADPVRSREHILLANILEHHWRAGRNLDVGQLIQEIATPPFAMLGVFPVETFFPEKDRMGLAMLLNGLIASPTFSGWMKGAPLDVERLLYGQDGKPQVSVLYIAHLSDAERMFFVTLLLEEVLGWVRRQSGTTSLRALLYMDELFGYLPPTANPPTKKPLLTLLKQARAFGLGLVLATQNPVDLDYKALANAGTWFIGRMQTDRDKQRLLDGLEGVEATAGGLRRSDFDRMISAIKSRVFLLHNVHQGQPAVITTRWAMSYLRGPLTLAQVREVTPKETVTAKPAAGAATPGRKAAPTAAPTPAAGPALPYSKVPPQLPSTVNQVFLPVQSSMEDVVAELARERSWSARSTADLEGYLVYEPGLLAMATTRYSHAPSRQAHTQEAAYFLPVEREADTLDWSAGKVNLEARDLARRAEPGAYYAELPSGLGDAKRYAALSKAFSDYLYYNSSLTLWHNPNLKLYSKPDETDAAFRRRCREAAEKVHQAEVNALKAKYERQLRQLEDKLRREERELDADKTDYDARKQEEVLSGVESVIGLFTGRRSSRRLSSASTKRRMTRQAKADLEESEQAIAALEGQIQALEGQAKEEVEALTNTWSEQIEQIEEVEVRPRRTDLQVTLFALAWMPRWEIAVAGQTLSLPAFKTESL